MPRDPGPRRQFIDAVLAFSEEPGPTNLMRYLAASRDLERSKRTGETTPALRAA